MIIMKFGGTSVRNAEFIDHVLDIALEAIDRSPVLVSSAMGDTTDHLVDITRAACGGEWERTTEIIERIRRHHVDTAGFLTGDTAGETLERIESVLMEITSLARGLFLLRECTPRSSDAILSAGELLSTAIIAARARTRGIPVRLLDSRDFVITDDSFSGAAPLFDRTNSKIRELVKPEKGTLIVAQGFIGRTTRGATTTLGRGGSDYSASIIGNALNAEEIQIWTDVNGIMTSDPRIVPDARTIDTISYSEAAELAYFGAKVVHPSTIQPAVEGNIPVLVKNTGDPDGPFTTIRTATGRKGITAIAGKKPITLINVSSSRMLNAYGFLNRIFAIFEKYRTSVDLIATSEVSVSMTIENESRIEAIIQELSGIGQAMVERKKAILCLVGQDLWKDPAFIARVFGAISDTPVRMVSMGSSDINLSIVVPEERLEAGIRKLHGEFFT